ncbi:MAG: signal peptide peptidase SppA [Novosphingobium sp.]
MAFARKVWHLLVAIKDGLVLLFMLLFFLALYAALTARPSAGALRDGALLLRLNGSVVEEPSARGAFEGLLSGSDQPREFRARDVKRAIELAATDDHIKAVVLDLSQFRGGGLVTIQELGAALDKVRAAKKPVLTYATLYTDDSVMLAAHSSEVWVNPMGGAFVMGPGGNSLYYAGLLQKLKVNIHVYRVGTYKDFVEPYVLTKSSDASKEARQALVDTVWEDWKADVAKARPKANIGLATSDPAAWLAAAKGDTAQAALSAGLVDKLGDEVAFGERVKQIVGDDPQSERPGRFASNKAATLLAAHPESKSGEEVAVVTVAGELVDGKAGPGVAGGARIAELIDKANAGDAKALVLRVDSPGGSVFASEQVRLALQRFKAGGRPVVVSMANMAASGGYWVSTPGQRIFAQPGTITGSIGIFAILPSFEKTLADYGVTTDGARSTPLSGQPDPFGGFSPEADRMMQASIDNGYARFIGLVAEARHKTPAEIDAIAQGRVWDGGTAQQKGLVDQFGGLDEALAYAAQAAKLESWHAAYYGSDDNPYASLLERMLAGDDADEGESGATDLAGLVASREEARLGQALENLNWLGQARGAQAICLQCSVMSPVKPVRSDSNWLAAAADLLLRR